MDVPERSAVRPDRQGRPGHRGAGQRAGEATARLFARQGAAVIVNDLVPERAEHTAREIEAAGGKAFAAAFDVIPGWRMCWRA